MFSKNAITVLEKRYLKKDENGKIIETPKDMFMRVARAIAEADREFGEEKNLQATADSFYKIMTEKEFVPNSPTLMNAGRELGQLSACFVLPVADSMEEIFDAVKNAALIHKSGGGTGFSFSRLRPKGASVNSTGGVASGPVSFMKVFNASTEAVKQGGTRRGANMGILRVDHPDIIEFIGCKKNNKDITNFNISVGITEAFMKAVHDGSDYALVDPSNGQEVKKISAREVFDLIVDMAWTNGEPGIIFLDRLNRDNMVKHLGDIESTNPCGEQPLLPYESCNLGSLNLNQFMRVKDGEYYLDYDRLKTVIGVSVHFLDNVITVNNYPLGKIKKMTQKTRKIGLGLMGFADVLYKLKIPYNSEEAISFAEELMRFIEENAKNASEELAGRRGPFPEFKHSSIKDDRLQRNATVTTIAPTGTISIICGASSGIEPVFALSFIRNVMDNNEMLETHPYFEEVAKERGFYSKEMMEKIAKEGTIAHIKEIPDDIKRVFVTSHDISPDYHIRMQAAFQKYTDNAVSKTVNFPNNATQDDVREVYELAYELELKGVTIYRDGSREAQVLNIGKVNREGEEKIKETDTDKDEPVAPRVRPELTQGITQKVKIGCGNLYVTVNYDENGICEVFTNLGRAGGCPSQSEATSRLVSTALRSGIDIRAVIEQLRGIRCHSTLRKGDVKVLSCPDAIGRVLERAAEMHGDHFKITINGNDIKAPGSDSAICPECGSLLEHEGGCNVCRSCGYSKCG